VRQSAQTQICWKQYWRAIAQSDAADPVQARLRGGFDLTKVSSAPVLNALCCAPASIGQRSSKHNIPSSLKLR
jgi:hypothetical protein